jgi:hypothetical protein
MESLYATRTGMKQGASAAMQDTQLATKMQHTQCSQHITDVSARSECAIHKAPQHQVQHGTLAICTWHAHGCNN